jgi:hypothetical protein
MDPPPAGLLTDSVLSPGDVPYVIRTELVYPDLTGNLAAGRESPLSRRRAVMSSRVGAIVASIVAGILLAAGAAYGVTAIATTPQTPANQNPYNYGSP